MILSRPDLIRAWKTKQIRFLPDISEEQIGLSSIDLRLGYVSTRLKKSKRTIRPAAEGFDPTYLVENYQHERSNLIIRPRQFRLALTLERVSIPGSLAANVQGKSSLARAGLAVHITAPHIHPGFTAPIALELYNHGPWTLEFLPGRDLVCQIIFFKVSTNIPAKQAKSLGTYMDQATPFPPRERREKSRSVTKVDWRQEVLWKALQKPFDWKVDTHASRLDEEFA